MFNMPQMIVRLADLCEAEGRLLRINVLDLASKGAYLVIAAIAAIAGILLLAASVIVLLTQWLPVWLALMIPAIVMLAASLIVLIQYRRQHPSPSKTTPSEPPPMADLASTDNPHALID